MPRKNSEQTHQCKTVAAIDNLANQLLSQRVVFFVGAGFSLSIEGVSTTKLMTNLLCRFISMTESVDRKYKQEAKKLQYACNQVFSLGLEGNFENPEKLPLTQITNQFVSKYYQVNEWMVQAFSVLYSYISDWQSYCDYEREFHELFNNELDLLPLASLNENFLEVLEHSFVGKVIFIETVGLDNNEVMQSYANKPLPISWPRYIVFGKLAREGLLPTLLTTNYDLLLECGYQSVGLDVNGKKGKVVQMLTNLPTTALSIRQPQDFFNYSASMNPAHILKIHGCAQQYRQYKQQLTDSLQDNNLRQIFQEYLTSIIYTYREIQHWRDDDWSRDYLHTLLRTRTFVFCGYSGADPVMHNSIRNIYEEMHRKTNKNKGVESIAPAFSTSGGSLEFDSLELLNAASHAIGKEKSPTGHNNFLNFNFSNDFPCCDMVFRVLCHKTLRLVQQKILAQELPGLTLALFNKPKPEREKDRIVKRFENLKEIENNVCLTTTKTQRQIELQLSWTEHFYQQVLMLFLPRQKNEGAEYYRPLRATPLHTCVGIIIELAVRRIIELLHLRSENCSFIESKKGELLTLSLCYAGRGPIALSIVSNENRLTVLEEIHHCSKHVVWVVTPQRGLWVKAIDSQTPNNTMLWDLACGKDIELQEIEQLLEG